MRNSWGEYTFHLTRIRWQPTIFSGRCETRFLEKAAHLAAAISSCEFPAPNFPTKNHMPSRMVVHHGLGRGCGVRRGRGWGRFRFVAASDGRLTTEFLPYDFDVWCEAK